MSATDLTTPRPTTPKSPQGQSAVTSVASKYLNVKTAGKILGVALQVISVLAILGSLVCLGGGSANLFNSSFLNVITTTNLSLYVNLGAAGLMTLGVYLHKKSKDQLKTIEDQPQQYNSWVDQLRNMVSRFTPEEKNKVCKRVCALFGMNNLCDLDKDNKPYSCITCPKFSQITDLEERSKKIGEMNYEFQTSDVSKHNLIVQICLEVKAKRDTPIRQIVRSYGLEMPEPLTLDEPKDRPSSTTKTTKVAQPQSSTLDVFREDIIAIQTHANTLFALNRQNETKKNCEQALSALLKKVNDIRTEDEEIKRKLTSLRFLIESIQRGIKGIEDKSCGIKKDKDMENLAIEYIDSQDPELLATVLKKCRDDQKHSFYKYLVTLSCEKLSQVTQDSGPVTQVGRALD